MRLRLLPALTYWVLLAAFLLCSFTTSVSPYDYFHDGLFVDNFKYIFDGSQFRLRGIFKDNSLSLIVN